MNKTDTVDSRINHFAIEGKFGEISIFTIDHFNANLEIAIPFKEFILDEINNGLRKMIIDLTYVDYMDSTFIGTLVVLVKRLGLKCGHLKLVIKKDSAINLMLELTNMHKIFDIFHCIEDAKLNFLETEQDKLKL